MRYAVVGVLAFGIGIVATGGDPARAELDEKTAARIGRLNETALRDIAARKLTVARKALYRAEALGIGLWTADENTLLAETYVELGALEIIERDDRDVAAGYFRQALRLKSDVGLTDARIARDDVQQLFSRVRHTTTCKDPLSCLGAQNPADPDFPVRVSAFDCPLSDDVMEGADLVVRCAVYPKLPVVAATLHYRPDGAAQYATARMRRTENGWWAVTAPGKSIGGNRLQWYACGDGAAGKPIVCYGQEDNPNIARVVPRGQCDCERPRPNNYPETAERQ